ncbi:MAG TPA: hypothetical protein VG841_12860 [Caulobacterales bacterium]|nr:hypothetical protein [Caulobacterales bacterium]
MGAIGKYAAIAVGVLAVTGIGGYVALPSAASKSQSISVPRPSAAVFARLSSTPANTQVAPGVTVKRVVSAENNVVVEEISFADGGSGRATYTVRPDGDEATHVDVKIERNLGANPVDRVQGLSGAPVASAAAVFFPAVTTDLNALPNASFAGLAYQVVQAPPQPFFYVQKCTTTEPDSIIAIIGEAQASLPGAMRQQHLQPIGHLIAVEPRVVPNQYCFQVGFPFSGPTPRATLYEVGQTPSGTLLHMHYTGTEQDVVPQVYDRMDALLAAAHLDDPTTPADDWATFETYNDDPTQPGGSRDREIYYVTKGDISRLAAIAPPQTVAPPAAPAAAVTTTTTEEPATTVPAATTTETTTTP